MKIQSLRVNTKLCSVFLCFMEFHAQLVASHSSRVDILIHIYSNCPVLQCRSLSLFLTQFFFSLRAQRVDQKVRKLHKLTENILLIQSMEIFSLALTSE